MPQPLQIEKETGLIVGILALALMSGFCALAAVLMSGGSILQAILAYSGTGAATLLMDGIELCRHLRANPATRFVPLIMLTARADPVHLSRAFAAGADDYLVKPFDAAELRLMVMSLPTAGQGSAVPTEHRFRDRQNLDPIPGLLRQDAARNFLLRRHMRRPAGEPDTAPRSKAFAIRMRDADALHAMLGKEAFGACVRQVAEALSAETPRAKLFLTYQGAGVFLCLPRQNVRLDVDTLAGRVNERLARVAPTAAKGHALPLSVDALETKGNVVMSGPPDLVLQGKDNPA